MKTSVPEQTIFFYVKKFIDPFAMNKSVRIGCYTADIVFCHKQQNYDVEYDAFSTHAGKVEADVARDKAFREAGYTVIRMRDRNLPLLPDVINIEFDFQDYRKPSILRANEGINRFLSMFECTEPVDISHDLESIRALYRRKVS